MMRIQRRPLKVLKTGRLLLEKNVFYHCCHALQIRLKTLASGDGYQNLIQSCFVITDSE
jgi:hypothetical protein